VSERLELAITVPEGVIEAISVAIRDEVLGLLSRTQGPPEEWRLWNLSETARRLGRSERWVRDRVKEGKLSRIRLDGGALAFDPADVHAFARERRIPVEDVRLARDPEGG
jgi:hypothetical protein